MAGLLGLSLFAARAFEPHDDAYISFRYADNLATGNGLVFNLGERVEGFSTPSFVLLIATAIRLGIAPETAAVAISAIALATLLLVASLWARELAGSGPSATASSTSPQPPWASTVAGLAGALAIAAHPGIVYYLLSSMETLLFAGLIAIATFLVRRTVDTAAKASALGLILGALSITRPEAIGYVAVVCAIVLWDTIRGQTQRSHALIVLALAPTAWLAWMGFRLSYFEQMAPNTYYAKIGPWDLRRITRGVEYLAASAPWVVPPLVLVSLFGVRSQRGLWIALLPLGYFAAFATYSGGDWMAGQRLLLPATLSAAVLVGAAAPRLLQQLSASQRLLQLLAVAGAGLLLVNIGLLHLHSLRTARTNSTAIATFQELGQFIRTLPAEETVALGAVGAVSYSSDRSVIDAFGLTDRTIAREGDWDPQNTAGHQRSGAALIWAQRPQLIVPLNDASPEPLTEDQMLDRLQGDPNRFWIGRLRARPEFQAEYSYRTVELATGQHMSLYERRR